MREPEANAQIPGIAGHSEGADGKVFLIGKNFDTRRFGQFDTVFATQRFARASEQIENAVAVKLGFVRGHFDDEMVVGEGAELRHLIVERDEVVAGDIVIVLGMDGLGQSPSFVVLAEAQHVIGEITTGGEIG